jgi:hypothetical protein
MWELWQELKDFCLGFAFGIITGFGIAVAVMKALIL